MKKRAGAVVLLLATLVVAAAHGQEPRRIEPLRVEGFGVARLGGASVERIMSLRSELKLTEDQLRQLEEIRKQRVQREQSMIDLRSRAAAGSVDREALRSQMEEQRDQIRELLESTRDQIDKILTQEQRGQVQDRTRGIVVGPRGTIAAPLARGMRLREELRAAPRATPRLRLDRLPRNDTLNRLAPRFRNLNELTITPGRYYWFGNGPDRAGRVLRRRGLLE